MKLILDIQNTLDAQQIPTESQMRAWISQAINMSEVCRDTCEMTVRIVDEAESQQLNRDYRDKDKPTNVLSFPFDAPPQVPCDLLGDLVICLQVVENEAQQQGKLAFDHWAHMLVHGTLHLLGYDHIEATQAEQMESLEVKVLAQFKIQNPY